MSDTRVYFASGVAQLAKDGDAAQENAGLRTDKLSQSTEPASEPQYLATSPSGTRLSIPKELFVALSDFPGQIVVAVDQRRPQQHLIDAMLIIVRSPCGQGKTQHQTENAKHRHGCYSSKVISSGSIPAIIPRTV